MKINICGNEVEFISLSVGNWFAMDGVLYIRIPTCPKGNSIPLTNNAPLVTHIHSGSMVRLVKEVNITLE